MERRGVEMRPEGLLQSANDMLVQTSRFHNAEMEPSVTFSCCSRMCSDVGVIMEMCLCLYMHGEPWDKVACT